jgi:hypothetical protein
MMWICAGDLRRNDKFSGRAPTLRNPHRYRDLRHSGDAALEFGPIKSKIGAMLQGATCALGRGLRFAIEQPPQHSEDHSPDGVIGLEVPIL